MPPVSRTASGAGPQPFDAGAEPSLKPKSTSKLVYLALAVVVGGGAVGWKMYGHKLVGGGHVAASSDPNRRFFVYVKTDPEGANIFRADGHKLMGASPITLPIDLTGVSSVKLQIEKPGYEPYEQTIVNDDPVSISLTPIDGVKPAAAAPDAGAAPGTAPVPAASKPHHHHRSAPKPDKVDDTADAPASNDDE